MKELKKNDFEEYIKSFNDIYLNFYTKNLNIWVFILGIISSFILSLCFYFSLTRVFSIKNNDTKLYLSFFVFLICIVVYLTILIFLDYCSICNKISKYPKIKENTEIKKLKWYQIQKKFNKYLELYCTEKLVQENKIDKENFKLFFNELIIEIDDLKGEKPAVKATFVIRIWKFFKSELVVVIISYLFGLFGKQLELNLKLLYYFILFYFCIIVFIFVYDFFRSKNKNIDIEVERKFILMNILVEIFTNSYNK